MRARNKGKGQMNGSQKAIVCDEYSNIFYTKYWIFEFKYWNIFGYSNNLSTIFDYPNNVQIKPFPIFTTHW